MSGEREEIEGELEVEETVQTETIGKDRWFKVKKIVYPWSKLQHWQKKSVPRCNLLFF
jgi:hypothetical protein